MGKVLLPDLGAAALGETQRQISQDQDGTVGWQKHHLYSQQAGGHTSQGLGSIDGVDYWLCGRLS